MGQQFQFGPFRLDAGRGVLACNGEPVLLGSRAQAVLQALLSARGAVVTKDELMALAWPGTVVEEANLSVQIAALRKALAKVPEAHDWIATVSRVGYRFTGPLHVEAGEGAGPPAELAGKPSIAVLPFANLSGDLGEQYFADGITEDIITSLSRFRWFRVIARNSSFALKGQGVGDVARQLGVRYVMEGSVRRSGARIRITAALNDAPGASRIWSNRYDFEVADMFVVQDRIVEQVAGALEPELLKSEGRRQRTGSVTAWEIVRQGMHAFHQVTQPTHARARELFREAIAMEPELPDAHLWLARVSAGIVAYGWSRDPKADLNEGLEAAREAIRRDEQSPYAHYGLAIVSAYADEQAQAIRAAQRAIELNPSFALGYLVLGMSRLFDGQPAAAVEPLERGLRLNPHDPQNFAWYNLLGFARYLAGQPDRALEAAERARDLRSAWRPALELMVCCRLALGHAGQAAQCLAESERLPPPTDKVLEPLQRTDLWRDEIEAKLGLARDRLVSQQGKGERK